MHAPLVLLLALGVLPASKLGLYVAEASQADAAKLLSSCPRVAVFALPSGTAAGAIPGLRSGCPGTRVVLQTNTPGVAYPLGSDPAQSANHYWNLVSGSLAGFAPSQVDWVEGPGVEHIPDWTTDPAAGAWAAAFWSQLADRIHNAGYSPLVGAIPAGAPKLAGETGPGSKNLFAPIAEAMKKKPYPWGWSYQAFSTDLSTDAAKGAALRYRRIRTECALEGIPLVLSRGGQAAPGWIARGTSPADYLAWLEWLDARLHEDADVIGVALFQIGDTTGASAGFSLSPIAAGLAGWLGSASFPDAGAPAPRCDGGCAGLDANSGGSAGHLPSGGGATSQAPHGCSTTGNEALAPLLLSLLLAAAFQAHRRRR